MKTGLVLEGGGMRGAFTMGALDCLMDNGIRADYVAGVSAGAGHGASYISWQRGRSRRIGLRYGSDKRYLGMRSYIATGSIFGMDFIFDEIPNHLDLFDYEAFFASRTQFAVGATDVHTGKAVWFGKEAFAGYDCTALRASSSIPCFAPIVRFGDGEYLDGGISAPIPVQRALQDGCERIAVILTRPRSYQKAPQHMKAAYHRIYRAYPAVWRAMDVRHRVYNDSLQAVRELERQGRAIVIAPDEGMKIGRFEHDLKKLDALYRMGMCNMTLALAKLQKNGF